MRHNFAQLANLIHNNSARLLAGLTIGLLVLCAAIKSAKLDAQLPSWIQRTQRVESELNYVEAAIGEGTGSSSQLLIQTPRRDRTDVLTVEAFMLHLEAMAIATHLTIDLYDVSWSLKDLCFTPTLPDYEALHVSTMLDHMMPCAIKTPLDCFWEGAKLLGPEQPISLSTIGPKFKWTSLNPILLVEEMQRNHPHASFPYASLLDWMRRVGITTGYQFKPCLDPTDPNCPETAPNRRSGKQPNIGARLTGGCRGLAANQMHWREEEIVGGLVRNKSGHIIRASALQSTIQLMGEQDMYDYWRKTSKVQDINNWSSEKAKLVLDLWQHRFKEELDQFTRSSLSSNSYKIHAMTSKSMLEPIDVHSILELANFEICFAIMTIFTCIVFPNFTSSVNTIINSGHPTITDPTTQVSISRFKITLLAIVISSFVGLIFVASLGLSSFMDLPFNIATTQILPPIALYYGFNQFTMIANVYSQKYSDIPLEDLTTECLNELFPVIILESSAYIIALFVATIIPVQATRVFAFQAITFIALTTFAALVLVPSILTTFLKHLTWRPKLMPNHTYLHSNSNRAVLKTSSPSNTIRGKDGAKQTKSDKETNIEDQIFSIIQNDLQNLQVDSHHPTDINFSAQLGADGLRTSIRFTTSQTRRHRDRSTQATETSVPATETTKEVSKLYNNDRLNNSNLLPDLIVGSLPAVVPLVVYDCEKMDDTKIENKSDRRDIVDIEFENKLSTLFRIYIDSLTTNKIIQAFICIIKICIFVAMVSNIPKLKYGLQLRDIVAQGTIEYESLLTQEKYFPVYNVFAVTKGNFDYPTNQRLLYEYYRALEKVEGIVRNEDPSWPKFWLVNFRDWLLEIQQKFDIERNKSTISSEGWTTETSDASKLAYKLLAQTGRVDNPIDKSQVETNRLVDSEGIINPKAFYYYLTAWVINDAFTYANSEANFRPEPKIWNDNPDDLKVERARPLVYAQIPLLMKLPPTHDNLKTISDIRSISQAFEQMNFPNFPTGIPFIFWDQFINIGLLLFVVAVIGLISIYLLIGLMTSKFRLATIITAPIMLTLLELYGFMGYLAIPFNNIFSVLLVCTIGPSIIQIVPYTIYFKTKDADLITRTRDAVSHRSKVVINSLSLFFITALVFYKSNIDFTINYAYMLFCLASLNVYNSLLLIPVLLSLFGPEYRRFSCGKKELRNEPGLKKLYRINGKSKSRIHKKRGYPKVQSAISLSTISEEPQSEAHVHDLKFDFSIKCY